MSQTALKSDTLHENLVRELSRMAPGEKFMTVRDIMRRYNVSQLIVDRAVNRLCEDGKLVSFARRGLFVPQFVCPAPAEQPTLLVAVPDWVSPDIDEIKAELERLAPLHPETRLLLHRFDYRYAIPPELPLAAENVLCSLSYDDRSQAEARTIYGRYLPLVGQGRKNRQHRQSRLRAVAVDAPQGQQPHPLAGRRLRARHLRLDGGRTGP